MWDFIVWVVCERECEDSRHYWRQSGFRKKFHEKPSREVSHVQSTWLKCKESWQLVFASNSQVRPFHKIPAKHFVLLFCHMCSPCLHPHYLYTHYPYIIRSVFQRENPRYYPWELEIVIPTIIYTILCGFPLLLPLHIHILERLIAQTLTTPNLSVKWGFDAARKYWKKPIVWQMNRVIRES